MLEVSQELEKVVTIIGPRRAGKTFFLFQLMSDLEAMSISRQRMLYVNFEDERLELGGGNDQILQEYFNVMFYRDLVER